MENRGTVRSVAKAMELLQLLSERGEPLSLTEIARMQELPKSTAFGLLNTLREYEMVSQGRDGRYSLGIRLFEYGCRVSRAWDVPRLARPYLEQLAAQVNVLAVLSIREGDRVMTLDQVEGHGSLRVVSEVGGRLPLHCTSQGKVFLAALAESEAQALLGRRPLTAYTPHTVTDAAQLLASLEQVRRQGYAVEDGEYKNGLRSVSAPVYGVDGAVRCTVGIVGMLRSTHSEEFRRAGDECRPLLLVVYLAAGGKGEEGGKRQSKHQKARQPPGGARKTCGFTHFRRHCRRRRKSPSHSPPRLVPPRHPLPARPPPLPRFPLRSAGR